MRRLYWAVPFLIYDLLLLCYMFVIQNIAVALFNLLTFFLEYRYGGESKEGEELVVGGIVMSSILVPLGGLFSSFAVLLAGFMFLLELTATFVKTHRP